MGKKTVFSTTLLAVLLLFTTSVSAVDMPRFSLPDALSGELVNSDTFAGKVVLVSFFATWCPPCRMEVAELKSLQEKFAGKAFSVVGLSVDQGGSAGVAKFARKEGINYPVLMANYRVTRDFGGIVGIPTAFLVDKNGTVVKRYRGVATYDTLERDVTKVLP